MHFHYHIVYVFYVVCLNAVFLVQGGELPETVVGTNQSVHDINKSALYKFQKVTTVEDFFALLKQKDGENLSFYDVFSSYKNEVKKYLAPDASIAESDDCSPRKVSVRISYTDRDPKIVYFPRCTQLERCGGCCSSSTLECVPTDVEKGNINVLKAELESITSTKFVYQGTVPFPIERHRSCQVECKLTHEICGPHRQFMPNFCKCRCKKTLTCEEPLYWDVDECQCLCNNLHKIRCCDHGHNCGMALDTLTCKCKLFIESGQRHHDWWLTGPSTNHSEGHIGDVWSSRKNEEINWTDTQNETSSTTAITATRVATATTEAPANVSTADPCTRRDCPRAFVKVYNPATNSCLCRLGLLRMGPKRSPAP